MGSVDCRAEALFSGPVRLRFEEVVAVEPGGERVPYYHFTILTNDGQRAGHINFKMGDTRHVTRYGGHIGYGILPAFRGNAYAYHACRALAPFILRRYDKVVMTADPDNSPSIRVIERLGARFVEEVTVPEEDPSFAGGARRKRRYEWRPDSSDAERQDPGCTVNPVSPER
jgi:predicted acetyltransferase